MDIYLYTSVRQDTAGRQEGTHDIESNGGTYIHIYLHKVLARTPNAEYIGRRCSVTQMEK